MKTRYLRGTTLLAIASVFGTGCGEAANDSSDPATLGSGSPTNTAPATGSPGAGNMDAPPSVVEPLPPPAATPPTADDTSPLPPVDSGPPGGMTMSPMPVAMPEPVDIPEPEDVPAGSGGTPEPSDTPVAGMSGAGGSSEPVGGSGGEASEPPPSGDPVASDGCGMTPEPCEPCQANGLDYYVDMPDDYDPMRPYPVVFQYHPLGGSGQGARTMYNVRRGFPDAIYVSPDGSDNGFPNRDGEDEEVSRAIIESIEATMCIDTTRYFATGFSYGGSMSYTAAFCMGDIFRAIAPMAGATISGANSCDPARPVAAWINHGDEDTALPIEMSITLRDRLLETNGCSQETMPVDPSPCVEYQGCSEGYPVIWCEQAGVGHAIPSYGAASISEFFQQF